MKTRDAFALRNFDSERILARRFFDKFFTGTRPSDDEMLSKFNYTSNTVGEIYAAQEKLNLMTAPVKAYKDFIAGHCDRLNKYCQKVAIKIADGEGDIGTLKRRYGKAKDFYQIYLKISNDVSNLEDAINALIELFSKKLEKVFRRQFAKNLKAARIKADLTQKQLADDAMITNADLSKFENENKLPSLISFIKLSKALKVSADELLFDT